jgi:hypothetical protein
MQRNARLHNAGLAGLAAIGLAALVIVGFSQVAAGQEIPAGAAAKEAEHRVEYSPNVDQKFPNRVYWGVAHVHTGYSFDSGMFGVTLSPDDLFKVARGGEVVMDNGVRFKQDRPLDWVSSPTMPSTWASPIKFAPAALISSPIL